jgi:hypothetical protein
VTVFRPEHKGNVIGGNLGCYLRHYLAWTLIFQASFTLSGCGANNKVERGGSLGNSGTALHVADQVGRLVGGHFEHALLVIRIRADHNQPGDPEIKGNTCRGPNIFRKFGVHENNTAADNFAIILLLHAHSWVIYRYFAPVPMAFSQNDRCSQRVSLSSV